MTSDKTSSADNYSFYEQNIEPWVERNGFAHWAMALIWVFVAAVAFQVFGGILQLILVLSTAENLTDPTAIIDSLTERPDLLMLANTVAQFTMIAGGSLIGLKIHRKVKANKSFLRLQTGENFIQQMGLTAVLFIVAFPIVLFLGWINSFVPVSDFMKQIADQSAEVIGNLLSSENGIILGFLFIGITPAICEELLFRGYMFRAFEKSTKLITTILVTSLVFSMFHLDITGLLPRMFLGALLAYVTWTSDSLYPAMLGHLINNGGIVLAAGLNPEILESTPSPDSEMPWLLIGLSFIVTPGVLYLLSKYRSEINPKAEHV
ncbi:MAG TPA: CPBP family intramembrane metalloprotease domain-containing protein [Balneola sp.]|nr:CPBP family intramembrane metalloprotease domain-containing protein [Balneola sp.]MAO78572.1 CPBP family intramembrane metalloprotease domain-containing protein [Balneola sp.]MBF63198.1 CPBP family intramembrane metalloprotease domain-containing protein [Balneola sp.]HAH52482.1 CPBP family intramembrane metalloprotease domain-containing protein [Balneola sp.]HAW79241.1 CPBP family intramembrane metalloprotease domain-containing protein [Balneola sp.]|tara:strand:+ start:274 stop:1233 length:960 start_codon:yes stop_codon:yes gene_type:complete